MVLAKFYFGMILVFFLQKLFNFFFITETRYNYAKMIIFDKKKRFVNRIYHKKVVPLHFSVHQLLRGFSIIHCSIQSISFTFKEAFIQIQLHACKICFRHYILYIYCRIRSTTYIITKLHKYILPIYMNNLLIVLFLFILKI